VQQIFLPVFQILQVRLSLLLKGGNGIQLSWDTADSRGSCKHGNELSNFINGGKFLEQLKNYQLLKVNLAPWNYLFILTSLYSAWVSCNS
jgi:hypothetical protein